LLIALIAGCAMPADEAQPVAVKVPLTLTVQRADLTSRSVFTVQAEVRNSGSEKARHP
jgi:hypothetical protein